MNLEGRLLGNRYEIIEKIGNGGMATVYKAKCHVLNRFVAVKILKDEFTTDEEFVKRFNTEAQAVASLTHPNIVSVFDVGQEGNLYYIVMELVQGKTLKQIIIEDGALPWKWSVNMAMQIASALETAHKNNIIHRDIKPHNIVITEDGIAKVTDFGIAKAVSNSTITAFGTTIGSVHYFSPEHARGGYTDAKSDLYSLGVVMYEMLTGRVPFDADTPVSIALKHMQEEAIEPIKINPTIPISVNKIIIKAMQKDVNRRYASSTEMLRDLSMALKNPDGDFVVMANMQHDFPTQRIPVMSDKSLEEKIKDKEKQIAQDDKEERRDKKTNKFVQFFKEHKKVKIATIVLVCILAFALSLGGTYALLNASSLKDVQIPNLVGKSVEEAQKMLKELNFGYAVESEEFNAEIPAGFIISQKPTYIENYKIKEKETIKVVVSKGADVKSVPKLTGLTKEQALAELAKADLIAEEIEETSEKIEEGYVIKQDPKEGEQVASKSTVKVYVSKGTGIKKVKVPNVIGETEESAKKKLTDAGLKVTVAYEENTSKNNGTVLKQSIDSDKEVDENTSVTITVNKLAEIKKGTLNINIKSLTGYVAEKDEEGNIKAPKKVEVKVNVTSQGSEDTVYKESNSEDLEKLNLTINGVGNITIKVYIDGVLKGGINTLNLNDANPVLNIK